MGASLVLYLSVLVLLQERGASLVLYLSVLVLLQERGRQSCVITECSRVATGAGAPVLCYNRVFSCCYRSGGASLVL